MYLSNHKLTIYESLYFAWKIVIQSVMNDFLASDC